MTDCNAYISGTGILYVDNDSCYWTDYYNSQPHWTQNNRKEINDMIQRQTFLDALADEGKTISVEQREIIRDAKADKWELFIARLLARVFESADLVMLKEKPKEVLIKEA